MPITWLRGSLGHFDQMEYMQWCEVGYDQSGQLWTIETRSNCGDWVYDEPYMSVELSRHEGDGLVLHAYFGTLDWKEWHERYDEEPDEDTRYQAVKMVRAAMTEDPWSFSLDKVDLSPLLEDEEDAR